MSHVVTIDVEVRDLDALAKACTEIGCELRLGQKSYKWYGVSVGDYPIPQGFTKEELGTCEHAIRVKDPKQSGCYEVGLVRRRDGRPGYTLLWDFWQGGYGLQDAIGDAALRLRREYAAQVALKSTSVRDLIRQGYRMSRTVNRKGEIILEAVK